MPRTATRATWAELIHILLKILLVSLCYFCCSATSIRAQSRSNVWGDVVNLSKSGSASSPVVITQPDGSLRVFWWDQFDGVTMAEGLSQVWSAPLTTPIQIINRLERPAADGRDYESVPIVVMPTIVGDLTGRAHAFWLNRGDTEIDATHLMLSRLGNAETKWTTPQALTEGAVGFDATVDISNTLHLVYIRTLSTLQLPSGVYYRNSTDGGATWSPAVQVHTSRYYRLLSTEETHLDVEISSSGIVMVTWNDPRGENDYFSQSVDGGVTWRDPVALDASFGAAQNGRLMVTLDSAPSGAYMLWQATTFSGSCPVFQTSVADLYATQDAELQIMNVIDACYDLPRAHFEKLDAGQILMLLAGQEGRLTYLVWDGGQWSEPGSLPTQFEASDSEQLIYLSSLYPVLPSIAMNDAVDAVVSRSQLPLVVVGTDATHDVWVASTNMDVSDVFFSPPSPWSEPVSLSTGPMVSGLPAMVTDPEGRLHVLWAEPERADGGETVLRYARRDNERWSRVTTVLRSPDGGATAPTLAVQDAYLHALWSGGASGQTWYSRAFLQDAHAESGWDDPQRLSTLSSLSETLPGGHSDLISDGSNLHAVFAVPINEGRGIYYSYSEDEGETWSAAAQILDAAARGWAVVDNPKLALDYYGGLHVVWERPALSSAAPSEGVYYAWSEDKGVTWTEPNVVTDENFGHSEIVASAPGQVHLFWQNTASMGTWWHRWSVREEMDGAADQGDWVGWTRPEQVVELGQSPYSLGLAADGTGRLHLLSRHDLGESQSELLHTWWTGERWEQMEALPLAFQLGTQGVSASLQPETGQLSAILAGTLPSDDETPQRVLWYTGRDVPPGKALPQVAMTTQPTPMPTATPEPEPTMMPMPILDDTPPPGAAGAPGLPVALLLGGGLAALTVLGVFGVRALQRADKWFSVQ